MKKNRIILFILIIALCAATLVGCTRYMDLSKPDSVTIELKRADNISADLSITGATDFGELTSDGDIYTLSYPRIKKGLVTFSAVGYKTVNLGITPETFTHDSITVDFGATIEGVAKCAIVNNEELTNFNIVDANNPNEQLVFSLDKKKLTVNIDDIYQDKTIKISADGYETLNTSLAHIKNNGEVYLTKKGTCLVTFRKSRSDGNTVISDEKCDMHFPVSTSYADYYELEKTDLLYTIQYNGNETNTFNAISLSSYDNFFSDNNYPINPVATKKINLINADSLNNYQSVFYIDQYGKVVGVNITYIDKDSKYVEVPKYIDKLLLAKQENYMYQYAIKDINGLTELDINGLEFATPEFTYKAINSFTGIPYKKFTIRIPDTGEMITTTTGEIKGYFPRGSISTEVDNNSVSFDSEFHNTYIKDGQLYKEIRVSTNLNLKFKIHDYSGDIIVNSNVGDNTLNIGADGYYSISTTYQDYSSNSITINSVNNDFSTTTFIINKEYCTKVSDDTYTYDRAVYLNYYTPVNFFFTSNDAVVNPKLTFSNKTYYDKTNAKMYVYKQSTTITATFGMLSKTIDFTPNLEPLDSSRKSFVFDFTNENIQLLNQINVFGINCSISDCVISVLEGVAVARDNYMYVTNNAKVTITTPYNDFYTLTIENSDNESQFTVTGNGSPNK